MNSTLLFLIALLGGNGLSKEVITAMTDAQRDTFERWSRLITGLSDIVTTGIFVLRGMPVPRDASGNPAFTNEALSAQIKASFEEGKREAFWVALVKGVSNALLEFLRPSPVQTALMTTLLNRPALAQTTIVSATPAMPPMPATTTLTTQRTAGQVLRAVPNGMVRAQAVYFNPNTGEMAFE